MLRLTDLGAYLCDQSLSIREAMARQNATEYLFQVITDQDGRFVGTLTDGDIRRGILRGLTPDDRVSECAYHNSVVGRTGDDAGNLRLLHDPQHRVTFVPLLDSDHRVVEILVNAPNEEIMTTALIMAGGSGRRLGERTRHIPKPLLPVGGRPILDYVLERLENAGVADVYLSVHYLADKIERFVADRKNRVRVHLLREHQPLGTAGALGLLPANVRGPILVANGDIITHIDLTKIHQFHERNGLEATICVARHDIDVPFGVVRYSEDGLFESIEEKPRISNFIAAGMYYLGSEFMALVPKGRAIDMPELLNSGKSIGLRTGLFPIHEYWTDIGRPNDLETAEVFFARPAR